MGRIGPERHSFLSFSGRVWYGVDLYFFFFFKFFKFFFLDVDGEKQALGNIEAWRLDWLDRRNFSFSVSQDGSGES
jgi:hypothetical protein